MCPKRNILAKESFLNAVSLLTESTTVPLGACLDVCCVCYVRVYGVVYILVYDIIAEC